MSEIHTTEKEKLLDELETYKLYSEELEKARAEAISANKSKSDFLANMSHELRTPMNGIISMTEILLSSSLTESQKNNTETIYSSAKHLLALLNDILDISKVESGELQLQSECFDIKKLFQEIVKINKSVATEKSLMLNLNIEDSTPQYICSDISRLQQIIQNLIGNAVKFTENGMIDVNLKLTDNNMIELSVTDTGIGIPEKTIKTIFDKFTQADGSITRKFGGTGLGLAITKEITNLMGGELFVESKLGYGSTFTMSFPYIAPEEDSEVINAYSETVIGANTKVEISEDVRLLAVDDHPMNLVCLTKLLENIGIKHIDTAENGEEALALMSAMPYDIVFMDCMMPMMDGYEATALIRMQEEDNGEHQIIIAMTANAMVGDREKCLQIGMNDYVSKPISKDTVTKMLAKWLPTEYIQIINDDEAHVFEVNTCDTADESSSDKNINNLYTIRKSESVFEEERLEIFSCGELEIEAEIIHLFIEQTGLTLNNLKESAHIENCPNWAGLAHKIKGSSGNIGAPQMYALAVYAEKNANLDVLCRQEIYKELETAYGELLIQLKNRIS